MNTSSFIILTIVFIIFLKIQFVQTISCYTCTAGDDLFNVDSPNVIRCLSTCSYCYPTLQCILIKNAFGHVLQATVYSMVRLWK
ncbi:unnamed protein product [Rotaria magnacalcarata]